ncbi:MAG: hypothetical protein NVS3B7_11110 [Candidatus Elarobacter sp.]
MRGIQADRVFDARHHERRAAGWGAVRAAGRRLTAAARAQHDPEGERRGGRDASHPFDLDLLVRPQRVRIVNDQLRLARLPALSAIVTRTLTVPSGSATPGL